MEVAEKIMLQIALCLCCFSALAAVTLAATDAGDLAVLKEFRDGLKNPELLKWPENGDDPCGPPSWPHVFCTGDRVAQIQVQDMGLIGPLPASFNRLEMLSNLGLQRNHFAGKLPSFSGLAHLRYAYLDYNEFDFIPSDFFNGLTSLEVLALDSNPLNATAGWTLPPELQDSAQLTNLTLLSCNLAGPIPEFLGNMSSLQVLMLSGNRLTGGIPASFKNSVLEILWLNQQAGAGMSGPIDIVSTMGSLTSLWLHGNHFSGKIPPDIGNLKFLQDFNVNGNDLVGVVPDSLADMPLRNLDLNNNHLMGPVPKFKAVKAVYASNPFCQKTPGAPCAPELMSLLDFLDDVGYPTRLLDSWSGNSPCEGWLGLTCNYDKKVIIMNLARLNLSGSLSPSVGNLDSLTHVYLGSNNLSGQIPANWTRLKSLELLDLSNNNLSPPWPHFSTSVHLDITGNTPLSPSSPSSPSTAPSSPSDSHTEKNPRYVANSTSSTAISGNGSKEGNSSKLKLIAFIAPAATFALLICFIVPVMLCLRKRRNRNNVSSSNDLNRIVIHPRDSSDPDNAVKMVVVSNTPTSISSLTGGGSSSTYSGDSRTLESGNLVISVQVLRNVTKNFAPKNELGRGGFGVVYKGELDDGAKIAVKRMESAVISNKALHEFHSEITVLSKVRHRHLVSLLGYSIEGSERILVYEYMSQGALSQHLFHWKSLKLEPLTWKKRLNIALDVARGMEYLHNLAHQSFIHRDLKSSNILLDDRFRAKVSDFGLVKLAPNEDKSVMMTRLAGTFGYLAPEYAATGKITTKTDVFSYGVVLLELLTGLMALDEDRAEESRYLAAWFWDIKSSKEKIMEAVDPAIDAKEDKAESILTMAELAGHCTAREANQRPDMGHVVKTLASLADQWKKPLEECWGGDEEDCCGIDYSLPLDEMVKGWQEMEGKGSGSDSGYLNIYDSKGSIPSRPAGFADSFTSADGR